jgi:hypothetical protein
MVQPAHSCDATPSRWLELVLAEPPGEYLQEKWNMTGVWKKLQTRRSPLQGFRKSTSIMRSDAEVLTAECSENRA